MNLEDGEYYQVNGGKKILYWNGKEWMKPQKDAQKRFGAWLSVMDKQPIVKSATKIKIDTV